MTGPSYNSVGLESGRNIMRGCFDNRIDLALSRDIRMGGNRTLEFRLDVFNVFNNVIYTGRVRTQVQYNSPTDLTLRNSQTLADGSNDPARLVPRNAGFGAANGRAAASQHAAADPLRVLVKSGACPQTPYTVARGGPLPRSAPDSLAALTRGETGLGWSRLRVCRWS